MQVGMERGEAASKIMKVVRKDEWSEKRRDQESEGKSANGEE